MATTLEGLTLTQLSPVGTKYVATWRFRASALFPASWFSAPEVAPKVREALPGIGFVAVSNPAAVAGDEVIVYAVWQRDGANASTVADVVNRLSKLPGLSSALVLDKLAPLKVASSTDTAKAVDKARDAGNEAAAAGSLVNKAGEALGDVGGAIGGALANVLKPLAVPLIIAGVLAALYFAARAKGTKVF